MPGPGEYRPDPSEGIHRIEDLPKPNFRVRNQNYRRLLVLAVAHLAPTAMAGDVAPSTTWAIPSPDGLAT